MKPLLLLLTLVFLLPKSVQAQIYADITLREGESTLGTFRVLLHETEAPRAVANFIGLAQGTRNWINPATGAVRIGVPFYDGLRFHRLIHNFMLQGGDPLGNGGGGPGYVFQDQFHPDLRHDGPYHLSMAHSGPNSNGSQFFITLADASHLDDLHTVFGTVINHAAHPDSRDLIDGFTSEADFPTDETVPLIDIIIDSIEISGPGLDTFDPSDPQWGLPKVQGTQIALRTEADGEVLIDFDVTPKQEYRLYSSQNLQDWSLEYTVLNQTVNQTVTLEVSELVNPRQTFFTFPVVDYTHVPALPGNVFAPGNQFHMQISGGTLILEFQAENNGTWLFEDIDDSISTGVFQSTFPGTAYPGIPATGIFLNDFGGSWARAFAAREIRIEFNTPVGPNSIFNLQPVFSFHTETGGWYNGLINIINNQASSSQRGPFTWIPAP